jgi:hypothetical protein
LLGARRSSIRPSPSEARRSIVGGDGLLGVAMVSAAAGPPIIASAPSAITIPHALSRTMLS